MSIGSSSSLLLALGLAFLLAPWTGLEANTLENDDRANHTTLEKANHTLPIHPRNHTHNGTLGVRVVLGAQSDHMGELAAFCDEETNPCKIDNSSCVSGVCECDAGYVSSYAQTSCLLKASNLGDPCTEDIQCTTGISADLGRTKCLSKQCVCAMGLELRDNKCQRPYKLGTQCESNSECEVKSSICQEKLCICPPEFYPNANNDKCMPKSRYLNDSCEEDAQCEDLGEAQCRNNVCQCLNAKVVVSGKCSRRKALGDDCQESSECKVNDEKDKRECTQASCQCALGYKQKMDICIPSSATWMNVNLALLLLLSISYSLLY